MTSSSAVILGFAICACTVEAVEALKFGLTLVVAAGTTRGWRSAFEGATTALLILCVLVVAIGVPLIYYVPINLLRVIIGGFLLVLGLGWLRKAIFRSSGHKAMNDEDLIYSNTVAELTGSLEQGPKQRDAIGFMVAFKGVLLEGTEVVLIVLSFGASSHRLGLAAAAAGAVSVIVTVKPSCASHSFVIPASNCDHKRARYYTELFKCLSRPPTSVITVGIPHSRVKLKPSDRFSQICFIYAGAYRKYPGRGGGSGSEPDWAEEAVVHNAYNEFAGDRYRSHRASRERYRAIEAVLHGCSRV